VKRRFFIVMWRIVNPLNRPLAGFAPWWVLVETTGNKTGRLRRTPIAMGIRDSGAIVLIAAHGRACGWVRNLEAEPAVRIKHLGKWREGTASVEPADPAIIRRFNPYARVAGGFAGIDPMLVRIRIA
jgi:deazaflavin-dependent oxidoreductase (nitroreductase family)